ncbi:hypothetical protein A5784_07830 [Mycobacterium sp. 852013-50091_SCH5140682]|uniref:hypothetical protein n=1 Tax=Mycobacterium sp. 852013-50091_SCH5140682 TaxID=1834109 RepID=UPI0007E96EBE|nr:hypothetical protein [Mycobacterium sp. 852013-50091_SCH5140682]OBC08197.1 hypothetical protein A5784_07830 [Mycobacterium sp. 852013-50091_SCH5140682]
MNIKKLAAAAGIAGAVGIAAFGLDTGTAAAAPAQHSGTSTTHNLATTPGTSSHAGGALGSEESGGGSSVPRTFYPEMPHQGG